MNNNKLKCQASNVLYSPPSITFKNLQFHFLPISLNSPLVKSSPNCKSFQFVNGYSLVDWLSPLIYLFVGLCWYGGREVRVLIPLLVM